MSLSQQFSLLPNIEALWNFSCAVQKGGAPSSIFVVRKTAKRHKKAPTDTYGIGLGWGRLNHYFVPLHCCLRQKMSVVCCPRGFEPPNPSWWRPLWSVTVRPKRNKFWKSLLIERKIYIVQVLTSPRHCALKGPTGWGVFKLWPDF